MTPHVGGHKGAKEMVIMAFCWPKYTPSIAFFWCKSIFLVESAFSYPTV